MARKKSQAEKIASAAAAGAARAALEGSGGELEVEVEGGELEDSELDALKAMAAVGNDDGEVTFRLACIYPPENRGNLPDVDRDDVPNLNFLLRDRYGPGKYVLSACNSTTGRFLKRRPITISPLGSSRVGGYAPSPAASAGAAQGFNLQEWQVRQDRLEEQRHREAREDRKDLIALAGLVLPAILGRGQGPSLTDMTTALTNLRELSGGGGGLDTFIKGVELGKDVGGGSDSIPGVIREVIKDLTGSPVARSVMDRIASRGAPASPPATPAQPVPRVTYQPQAKPQGAIPVPNRPSPQGMPEPVWAGVVLPLLSKLSSELLEFAENGADPFLCAEALVGKTPRQVRAMVKPQQVVEWLKNPDWWTLLKDFKPELEPYQGYCDDVRQALVKLMTEPAEEPEQP